MSVSSQIIQKIVSTHFPGKTVRISGHMKSMPIGSWYGYYSGQFKRIEGCEKPSFILQIKGDRILVYSVEQNPQTHYKLEDKVITSCDVEGRKKLL